MASSHLFGEALVEFVPPGGSSLTSPFLLAAPLSVLPSIETDAIRERHAFRSADRATREVVVIPTLKSDLFSSIRYDNQPARLRLLIRHALDDDMALNYRLSPTGTIYTMEVEEQFGRVRPESSGLAQNQWRADLHFILATSDLDALQAEHAP